MDPTLAGAWHGRPCPYADLFQVYLFFAERYHPRYRRLRAMGHTRLQYECELQIWTKQQSVQQICWDVQQFLQMQSKYFLQVQEQLFGGDVLDSRQVMRCWCL